MCAILMIIVYIFPEILIAETDINFADARATERVKMLYTSIRTMGVIPNQFKEINGDVSK